MSLYDDTLPIFTKMLGNLSSFLDKAEAHAKEKNFDPEVLLTARLVPDQYPLVRQIQAACDAAKTAAARLSGKEPPSHPDTEKTWSEIRARIATCKSYVESVTAKDFEGAETRMVKLPFIPGKGMLGADYAREMAIPNFYFHLTTAYAILRHNGVPLGKMDYIASLTLKDL